MSPTPDTNQVKEFYDEFSARLLRDYIHGNRRVSLIHEFLRAAIPPHARRILEVGCGTGALAHFVRTRVARNAHIDALDLSSSNIEIAKAVFSSPGINFFQEDVLSTQKISGLYDVIIIPDVYEHFPRAMRPAFNALLGKLLAPEGRILLTCPAPGYFHYKINHGEALQVIDEDISLDDFREITQATDAPIIYLRTANIGLTNEFMHVAFERGAHQSRRVRHKDSSPLKMTRPHNLLTRTASRFAAFWRLLRISGSLKPLKARGIVPQKLWIPVGAKPRTP